MKCLEVIINGKKVCTAGVGDDGALNSLLSLVQRHNASAETSDSQNNSYSESLYLTVTGIANRPRGVTERLEWLNQDLDIGDELVIRIIQASACDEPTRKEVSYGGCSFCGKKQSEVAQLIAGPAVYVCNECVADCSNSIANGEPNGIVTMVIDKSAEETCSFCGQKPIEVERMVGVPAARICNQCVKICEDILDGKA